MNLYWVETDDHHEDWFVVAEDEPDACAGFEDFEGYDEGVARATFLVEVPPEVESGPGWPSDEVLEQCGCKILRADTPRVVEFGGRRFCEGMLEYEIQKKHDDLAEARGLPRMNETDRTEEM